MSKTYYGQCRLADKKPQQCIKKKNVHNWGGLVISITWLEKKDQLGRFTVRVLHGKRERIIKFIWVPL